MGGKKKVGKERLDKFYHLAKEQGYRSRAAFKLIQLAKKHDFFSRSQVCIDLCAAPGGWMQVAQKHMPVSSKIVGIDLAPIKPIYGCDSFQCDITTMKCRTLLKKELQGHAADVVLHDGAPNTGTSWAHDAYVQNELVLHSTKLACEFLRPGGTFVTKVFRSADYNALLWVFQQLFARVEATKPQASRNVSAEIFVLCIGFKAPSQIDPKFFDAKFVFHQDDDKAGEEKDKKPVLAIADNAKPVIGGLTEALKARGKKNRNGYEAGDDYRVCSVTEFLSSNTPIEILMKTHKIVFSSLDDCQWALKKDQHTTEEIKRMLEDIQVCGKGELTTLLKWRYKLLMERRKEKKAQKESKKDEWTDVEDDEEDQDEEDEEADGEDAEGSEDDEEEEDRELRKVLEEEEKHKKRVSKKQREQEKKKLMRMKMSLGTFAKGEYEPDLFQYNKEAVRAFENEDSVNPIKLGLFNQPAEDDEEEVRGGKKKEEDEEMDDIMELYLRDKEEDPEGARVRLMELQAEMMHDYDKNKNREFLSQSKLKPKTRRSQVYDTWAKELEDFEKKLDADAETVLANRLKSSDYYSSDEDETEEMEEEEEEEKEVEVKPKKKNAKEVSVSDKESLMTQRWFENPLLAAAMEKPEPATGKKRTKAEADDDDIVNELMDDELTHIPLSDKQRAKLKRKKETERKEKKRLKREAKNNSLGLGGMEEESSNSKIEIVPRDHTPVEESEDDEEMMEDEEAQESENGSDSEEEEEVKEHLKKPTNPNELAEIQAIGSLLINKKTRMDLIDGAWNRYVFDDDDIANDLPSWFIENDRLANKPQLPITKELMSEYRAKMKEINQRPIRKEQEAEARKKRRHQKRIERAKKASELIGDNPDLTESSKAKSIRKVMKKALNADKREKSYVVGQRTGGNKDAVRKQGSGSKNSIVKVVDKRLLKDKRGKKVATKKINKKKYQKK